MRVPGQAPGRGGDGALQAATHGETQGRGAARPGLGGRAAENRERGGYEEPASAPVPHSGLLIAYSRTTAG
jgi:hypothetical protein